ncbi:HTH_Tnp_Tc3_2 domain-containing protein [Trichonephila clavipes]|nr:HTH_Tnp_Tc3_2 domain-containing protein [Trichonephila clavipes]
MDGEQKTSDRANSNEQLALAVRGDRWLMPIVLTQLNDGATRTASKWTVQLSLQRMGFGSRQPTRGLLLNARHRAAHLAWAREHKDRSVEDYWKRVAWSDESRF